MTVVVVWFWKQSKSRKIVVVYAPPCIAYSPNNSHGQNYLRKLALSAVHIDVLRAESLLANELDRPDCWRNDVLRYLTSAREAVTKPDFYVPIDLPGNPEQRLAAFRRQVLAYGQLLTHWPALVEAARAMKSKGDALARPIRAYAV